MNKEFEIISDKELNKACENASFGATTKRDVIRLGVLKCASGYHQGHTSKTICEGLGLIDTKYKLTIKGRMYLWVAFSNGSNF